MAASQDIWVFSEKPELLAELIAGAQTLQTGGSIAALVIGPRTAAEQAIACGANQALWMGEQKQGYLVDDYIPTLTAQFEQHTPYLMLIGSNKRGRAVAGRLAARLGVTVITDVTQFMPANGSLQAQHLIFGGGAVRVERPLSQPILATVGQGVFAGQPAQAGKTGDIVEVPFVEPAWRATLRERKTRPGATVNLEAARKVICSGRGVARQEDLALINDLAKVIGAEVACTRPLAEGLGWLPRERYIGISGATIRPDLYLGVGVSGQVQHLIGMNHSRVVVAINKDSNAPIFSQADYGVVGDLYEVVPALIKALEKR